MYELPRILFFYATFFYECTHVVVATIVLGLAKGSVFTLSTQCYFHLISKFVHILK